MASENPVFMLFAAAVLCCALGPAAARAEPYATILDNGGSQNRIDIVLLGDGYTAAELPQYRSDAQVFVQYFFEQEPFYEYQRYFNVHRIDVTSNQSGADHPETSVYVDTALDGTYNCAGIQRLICVDVTTVNNIVANTLQPAQSDMIIVVVNDTEYGGSGGSVVVTSRNDSAIDIVLHEEGHSLGLLGDEYGGPPPPACNNSFEPSEVNVTRETQRALIKWGVWINPGTPIPTVSTLPGVPGLYQGALYCDTGLYRPTYLSKMRDLDYPFEQINTEQLIKRYYNLVSPLDSSLPVASSLTLDPGQNQSFSAQALAPMSHSLDVSWYVDGQPWATGSSFVLDGNSVTTGMHSVTVLVDDPTDQVRIDPGQVLQADRTWTVTVDVDTDADGISDSSDNCTLVANPAQLDSDGDGYGNICDADLNNSGLTTAVDFNLLRSVINQPSSASALAAAADLNGSGLVTSVDFNLLRARMNTAPGPAGPLP